MKSEKLKITHAVVSQKKPNQDGIIIVIHHADLTRIRQEQNQYADIEIGHGAKNHETIYRFFSTVRGELLLSDGAEVFRGLLRALDLCRI